MQSGAIQLLKNHFDALSQRTQDEDVEFWFARDLMEPLGYARWENFQTAINRAIATADGTRAQVQARLRITRDTLAGRMTLIGRVTEGGCTDPATARGIAGVRMVLEDGSFAVTDTDGRYHFEGVVPGNHVVQLGAFSSAANAEKAKRQFQSRPAGLKGRELAITEAMVNGRKFWRVAAVGFDSASAGQTCGSLKRKGGACFAYAADRAPTGLAVAKVPAAKVAMAMGRKR